MALTIKDLIQQLSDTGDVKYCVPAKILAVDKANNTVDVEPLDGSADLVEVRLQAQKGTGIVCYPVEGSIVIVSFLEKNDGYVSMFSEVESIDVSTEQLDITVTQYSLSNSETTLKEILKTLSRAVQNIKVTTPSGPSTTVINLPDFLQVDNKIDSLFSK